MKLDAGQKIAGILQPVFAIRTENDLGVGDTEGVRQMVDWCQEHSLHIFQTLPLNETGEHNSPYDAISSLAIDPTTLALTPQALPDLSEQKFAQVARPALLRRLRAGPVHYPEVKKLKHALLQAAFDSFLKHHFNAETERAGHFRAFIEEHAAWLPEYALFRLLLEENGQPAWDRWPREHQTPAAARAWLAGLPEKAFALKRRRQLYFMYVQWVAFGQWQALKRYAEERKVFLMGDIPFGVSRNSADVWANREFFDLDWSGGAPPEKFFKVDAFTEQWGQNWGIADFHWEELRRRDFAWWRRRVEMVKKSFHLCRIDHAPGFFRIYSFPWPPERNGEFTGLTEKEAAERTGGRLPCFKPFADDSPAHKIANQRHGEEIFRVVIDAAGEMLVVAEDLGLVPEYLPASLVRLGIPGYRIPSFFRDEKGHYLDTATYPRLSLAQPATHDHAPLAAAWAEFWRNIDEGRHVADSRRELRSIMRFAGVEEAEPPRAFSATLREGYLRHILEANSWLAVVMITDVFGDRTRFNTPGSSNSGNWSHRVPWTVRALKEDAELRAEGESFARMAREAKRTL